MNDEYKKEEIIRSITDVDIVATDCLDSGRVELDKYNNIPWSDVIFAGTALSSLLPVFRTAMGSARVATEGLYQADALGKVGSLAQASDGSGYLGTIINSGKFVGQMRWHSIEAAPLDIKATIPVDPMTLAMSAIMIEINMKLDKIQELQQEMYDYIKDRDRAEIKGSLRFLIDTLNDYKFNWDNKKFLNSKLNEVQSIERLAHGKIIFYRDEIAKKVGKQDLIHFGTNVDGRIKSVKQDFNDYKLSLGMYSFSVYLEVLLNENFDEDYLRKKSTQIYDQSIDYERLYTEAYQALKKYSTNTVEQALLGGVSSVSKGLGSILSKSPIGDATPIDSLLFDGGKAVECFSNEISDKSVKVLSESKDCDVRIFSDSIDKIRDMYNGSMEFLFTDDGLHYRELPLNPE